jgi:hypothetical protein
MVLRYQHYFAGNVTVEQAAVGYTPGATQPDSGSLPILLAVSLRARKKHDDYQCKNSFHGNENLKIMN